MAHHQHHGAEYDAQVSRSLQTRPRSTSNTHMPMISEDELLGEPEEPPDMIQNQSFTKTRPWSNPRRQSLLTKALHTDSESHDEHPIPQSYYAHLPSVSSTCSNLSSRSTGDFTSDDGHVSPSTRASTPGSPQSVLNIPKLLLNSDKLVRSAKSPSRLVIPSSTEEVVPEPTVEAQLGRKRCITFACGGRNTPNAKNEEDLKATEQPSEPPKRPCALKFVCPFTASKTAKTEAARTSRRLSPAPFGNANKVDSPRRSSFHRRHRDSDTTIRNASPKTPRAQVPTPKRGRRPSNMSDLGRSEACRFHEFASEDEEVEEWTQQSSCYSSRMTVNDTLKQENHIRQLAEEADEEAAEEGLDDEEIQDDLLDIDEDEDISDDGFLTDDEDGFADSDDDEEDDNSDYEWWAPRRTRAASPYIKSGSFQPMLERMHSDASLESSDNQISPNRRRGRRTSKKMTSSVITARPVTPELPDSTDFVCGTLDEDRPLEQAYISAIHQREAAKHRAVPQDIDPSFPTSDPELESDDDEEDDDDVVEAAQEVSESDHHFFAGRPDLTDRDEPRGRRLSPAPTRSPPPGTCKKTALPRSPAPVGMFGNYSPRRLHSPPPPNRLPSPPPSRRGSSATNSSSPSPSFSAFEHPFLGSRDDNITHTASLPRSPHPFVRRRTPSTCKDGSRVLASESEEDEGEATEHAKPYARGAIDIAQGLERKRLKRREKFYKQYLKKEEKRKAKRPQPGKGAQRMRQVGLECAQIRGTRMLSI